MKRFPTECLSTHIVLYMTYEDIWQKVKRMRLHDRKQLAYEMTLKDLNVGYVHPTTTLMPKACIQYSSIPRAASMRLMIMTESIN